MPYYESPHCGGGNVVDVSPSARPLYDRLKRANGASYGRSAREV